MLIRRDLPRQLREPVSPEFCGFSRPFHTTGEGIHSLLPVLTDSGSSWR